jgi:hypothetical protein
MWCIIQSSTGICFSSPETIARFKYRYIAKLYKFWHYDFMADPAWRGSFSWEVIQDKSKNNVEKISL